MVFSQKTIYLMVGLWTPRDWGGVFCPRKSSNIDGPKDQSKAHRHTQRWSIRTCPMAQSVPSGKLTWQWKMDQLKMYSLLKMGIFHCHVSLLEGTFDFNDVGAYYSQMAMAMSIIWVNSLICRPHVGRYIPLKASFQGWGCVTWPSVT